MNLVFKVQFPIGAGHVRTERRGYVIVSTATAVTALSWMSRGQAYLLLHSQRMIFTVAAKAGSTFLHDLKLYPIMIVQHSMSFSTASMIERGAISSHLVRLPEKLRLTAVLYNSVKQTLSTRRPQVDASPVYLPSASRCNSKT